MPRKTEQEIQAINAVIAIYCGRVDLLPLFSHQDLMAKVDTCDIDDDQIIIILSFIKTHNLLSEWTEIEIKELLKSYVFKENIPSFMCALSLEQYSAVGYLLKNVPDILDSTLRQKQEYVVGCPTVLVMLVCGINGFKRLAPSKHHDDYHGLGKGDAIPLSMQEIEEKKEIIDVLLEMIQRCYQKFYEKKWKIELYNDLRYVKDDNPVGSGLDLLFDQNIVYFPNQIKKIIEICAVEPTERVKRYQSNGSTHFILEFAYLYNHGADWVCQILEENSDFKERYIVELEDNLSRYWLNCINSVSYSEYMKNNTSISEEGKNSFQSNALKMKSLFPLSLSVAKKLGLSENAIQDIFNKLKHLLNVDAYKPGFQYFVEKFIRVYGFENVSKVIGMEHGLLPEILQKAKPDVFNDDMQKSGDASYAIENFPMIYSSIDLVVVLSGRGSFFKKQVDKGVIEDIEDDYERMCEGIRIAKQVYATTGKQIPIFYNGRPLHNQHLREAIDTGMIDYPKELFIIRDIVPENTIGQVKSLKDFLEINQEYNVLAVVSMTYHLARVGRTLGNTSPTVVSVNDKISHLEEAKLILFGVDRVFERRGTENDLTKEMDAMRNYSGDSNGSNPSKNPSISRYISDNVFLNTTDVLFQWSFRKFKEQLRMSAATKEKNRNDIRQFF